ncbi:MAG: 2-dehydro-3-deoxygalactonokinase, partial [Verrucomicrobiota bacterium]
GTHAKWVETDGNEVRDFHTAMTGEVFAAVLGHTLFASLAAPPASGSALRADSFSTGIARSAPPHGLLHAFFELRAGILLEQLEPTELADLISGLLIGTEIRHMASSCRPRARIALLGATGLAERYAHALRVLEFIPVIFDVEEVTTRGFAELARLCAEDGACSGGL